MTFHLGWIPTYTLEKNDFSKLNVRKKLLIPWSGGVGAGAIVYIKKWNALGFGCIKGTNYSVGLYDLKTNKVSASVDSIHRNFIANVLWIELKNYLVTGSDDSTIRVFRVSNEGTKILPIKIIRGHTQAVRCLKYLESEDLLVTAGMDADIKLWSMQNFKRHGTICTNSEDSMDGSIAYIQYDKLIGFPFRAGFIRFYHLLTKKLVFQLNVSQFVIISYFGLQYLPQKKMIISNSSEKTIKMWQYIEGAKMVSREDTISVKDVPYCIVANEDESQLMYQVNKDGKQCLETYSFNTLKTMRFDLPNEIKRINCLISLGGRQMLSADVDSGNICILG